MMPYAPTNTKILHFIFLVVVLSCSTSAVAQWFRVSGKRAGAAQTAVAQETGLRALPGSLPQGRLYCADNSKLGYMRLHPQVFQQISHDEALEFGKKQVEESCDDSWTSAACKDAQATLSLLRKSVKLCW